MRAICSHAKPLFVGDKPIKHRGFTGNMGMFSVLGADGNPFGGTDTLSYTAVGTASIWLSKLSECAGGSLVFGEGDRLANQRFFDEASRHYNLALFYLQCPNDLAESRRLERAKQHGLKLQNSEWVRGRGTKHLNLAKANPSTRWLSAADTPQSMAQGIWAMLNATHRHT